MPAEPASAAIRGAIAGDVEFFHLDAPSSYGAAESHPRPAADTDGKLIGNGYATAESQQIFRDFNDAAADVTIWEKSLRSLPEARSQTAAGGGGSATRKRPSPGWEGGA